MSLGYIRRHPRIQHLARPRDDSGRYALAVGLAATLPGDGAELSGWVVVGWLGRGSGLVAAVGQRPPLRVRHVGDPPAGVGWLLPRAAYDQSGNPSWLPAQLAVQALCARLAETLASFDS